MDSFIENFHQKDVYSYKNGIKIDSIKDGRSKVILDMSKDSLNCWGTLHGAALFTLADVASGACVAYHGLSCVTLNSSMSFIRPGIAGRIIAHGQLSHIGKTTAVSDVEIQDENDKTICKCTFTMYITGEISL